MGMDSVIATTTDINENVEKEAQLVQASKLSYSRNSGLRDGTMN